MASLQLSRLSKIFPGDVRAVDLSLDVAAGELLVLVGPSGCGKTTTLRMIAGLESPSSGTVAIGGRDVTSLSPAARNVAMAFQDHALYPHLNVYENLAFGLRMRKEKPVAVEAAVHHMVDVLGLDGLVERAVHELSEGQRQRVALGRALVRKPDCFLLDEPLASLDESLRSQLRDEIKRLHRELQTTMLFVTHDQHEAMLLGDRIAVLDRGQLMQCARPEDVYHRPANRRVATMIGTPGMNLLSGRLVEQNGETRFDAGPWQLRIPAALAARLKQPYLGDVLLGVRPPAVQIVDSSDNAADSIPARVLDSRSLGDVRHVRLELPDNQQFEARIAAGVVVCEEETCRVVFESGDLHFFAAGRQGSNLLAE